jgi:hypothetical protein
VIISALYLIASLFFFITVIFYETGTPYHTPIHDGGGAHGTDGSVSYKGMETLQLAWYTAAPFGRRWSELTYKEQLNVDGSFKCMRTALWIPWLLIIAVVHLVLGLVYITHLFLTIHHLYCNMASPIGIICDSDWCNTCAYSFYIITINSIPCDG